MSNVPQPVEVKDDPVKPVKAIVGALVTFLGLLWANLQGQDDWSNMTGQEWVNIVIPTILAFGAIYGFSNPKVIEGG